MSVAPRLSEAAVRTARRVPRGQVDLKVGHASGKWSARPRRFARYLRKMAARGVDLITTTESKGMLDAVRAGVPTHEWCLAGEFLVGIRKTRGSLGPGRLATLSNEFHGSSDWRDNRTHVRWVKITGFGPVLVLVTHASSAVQDGDDWSGFDEGVDSHQSTTRRIGQIVARRERLAPGVPVIVNGDWNVHLGMPVWRRRLSGAMGLTCAWDVRAPNRGTHGPHRVIDGTFANRRIMRPRVGPSGGGVLDHKWVVCTVRLGPPAVQDYGTITPLRDRFTTAA